MEDHIHDIPVTPAPPLPVRAMPPLKASLTQLYRDVHRRVSERFDPRTHVLIENPTDPTKPLMSVVILRAFCDIRTMEYKVQVFGPELNVWEVPVRCVYGPVDRMHRKSSCNRIREEYLVIPYPGASGVPINNNTSSITRAAVTVPRTRRHVPWVDTTLLVYDPTQHRILIERMTIQMGTFHHEIGRRAQTALTAHFRRRTAEVAALVEVNDEGNGVAMKQQRRSRNYQQWTVATYVSMFCDEKTKQSFRKVCRLLWVTV
eukprot:PhF_6_TR41000/c0_g1_i1/m.62101